MLDEACVRMSDQGIVMGGRRRGESWEMMSLAMVRIRQGERGDAGVETRQRGEL